MGVVGAALRGFGRALKRKASIQIGKRTALSNAITTFDADFAAAGEFG